MIFSFLIRALNINWTTFQGLVQSKQKLPSESPDNSSCTQDTNAMSNSTEEKGELIPKTYEESCPICQEKLGHQRMVFQCGHVTCCRCKYYMTKLHIIFL
jgi:E3 ubiquitin-protein ligase SHPRH